MATSHNWGWENGSIVPAEYLGSTSAGRKIIRTSGTPEIIEALGELRKTASALSARYHAAPIEKNYARLNTIQTVPEEEYQHPSIRWIFAGGIAQKWEIIAAAKKWAIKNGGSSVLIMLRDMEQKAAKGAKHDRNEYYIAYKVLLLVPRPTKIRRKSDGRKYLDWKPVVIEPPRGDKPYPIRAIETYRDDVSSADDLRVDPDQEVRRLEKILRDMSKVLVKKNAKWQTMFHHPNPGQKRASTRATTQVLPALLTIAVGAAAVVISALLTHRLPFPHF